MFARRSIAPLAVVVAAASVTACAAQAEETTDQEASTGGPTVAVGDSWFDPETIEVAAGGTVTWVWEGSAGHDVVGDGFASEVQRSGTFTHTFTEAGTYDYVCTLHPGMTGQVEVSGP